MPDCNGLLSVNDLPWTMLKGSDPRRGRISTRNAPGTDASFIASIISVYIRKNSLSGVSAWIPYAIESASEPVSLSIAP